MDREEALTLVKAHVHRANLLKHILAVEAIMRELAGSLDEDVERWGILGILHDLDFDETLDTPEYHGTRSAEMLTGKADDELLRGIRAHSYMHTGVKAESKMEKALIAADAVSGLIIACALVMPGKKLSEVGPENIAEG
jgi:predicted hydrolase (HD superfamily)